MPSKRSLIATLVLLLATGAGAQQVVSDTQGLGTVPGTGARALGMGGAYTALADDPTATSWNPAGLARLDRPQVLLAYDWYDGTRDLSAEWIGTFDPDRECGDPGDFATTGCLERRHRDFNSRLTDSDLAFFGGVCPFTLGGWRMVAAASYRSLVSFPEVERTLVASWRLYSSTNEPWPPHGTDTRVERDLWGGGIDAYSGSLATQLGTRFRVGLTVSYLDSDLSESYLVHETYWADATKPRETLLDARYSFSDVQADLGVQWQVLDALTVGAVYHFGFETDVDSSRVLNATCDSTYWGPYCGVPTRLDDTSQIEWPAGWVLGLAWQVSDRFVIAADYGQTEWSKATQRGIQVPGWDQAGNPTAVDLGNRWYPYWADQNNMWEARLGAEYRVGYLGAEIPFRLGYYRERQPLLSSDFTWGENPPDGGTYESFTAGVGVQYKQVQFDLAWVHTKGDDSYPLTVNEGADVFDVDQHSSFKSDRAIASLTYRF